MTDLTDITVYLAVNDIGEVGTSMESAEDAISNLYWESGLTGAVNTFRIDTSVPRPKLGDVTTTHPPLVSSAGISTGVGLSASMSRSWSTSSTSNITGNGKTEGQSQSVEDHWQEPLESALQRMNSDNGEKK